MSRPRSFLDLERLLISFSCTGDARKWPTISVWMDGHSARWVSDFENEAQEWRTETGQFDERTCAIANEALVRALNWLDGICFHAADLGSIWRACHANPNYGLRCIFIGSESFEKKAVHDQ